MNVGKSDRLVRLVSALGLLFCAAMAPFPLAVRVGAMALPGLYLLATAAFGSCLGYRLMGRSTCPVDAPSGERVSSRS
jgi:hypothetical protein